MARPRIHDISLRNQMLDEAARITATEGVDGLSARRLCSAVNTSTTAVYTLFGGMDGIRFALYRRAAESYHADFSTIEYDPDRPLKYMDEAMFMYRNWALANPNLYSILFDGALKLDHSLPETQGGIPVADMKFSADLAKPSVDAVRRAIELGQLPIPENKVSTFLISSWACMHGLVSMEISAETSGTQSGLVILSDVDYGEKLYADAIRSLTRGLIHTYQLEANGTAPSHSTKVLDDYLESPESLAPGQARKSDKKK
ncbi:TetR/AcrR family transcriptional regulator [Neomicrococcus lactis]|uniref:AcrR family transcriptional regulator n=1 Tax=Neomicrococcus lactis TaxID=732241 RepID=A0A7W8YCV1_9MICC|nr:TetR-like C-terminal domain-containing protein [Neomicrococcus lactis]MBB5599162.1 AcrR family transcriptional regulator [Neomicrococcus lactis]